MRRLTLRLPETLFHRLELLADSEGISLNQYMIYSLTQSVARAYRVLPVPKEEIESQHEEFNEIIASLETISDKEFDAIIAEGEDGDGNEFDPEIKARIEAKITAARES